MVSGNMRMRDATRGKRRQMVSGKMRMPHIEVNEIRKGMIGNAKSEGQTHGSRDRHKHGKQGERDTRRDVTEKRDIKDESWL